MTETHWEDEDFDRPSAEYQPRPPSKTARVAAERSRWGATPRTWAESLERLAFSLGGNSPENAAGAEEWLAQAVEACWGTRDLFALSRPRRQVALQRTVGTVLWLEEQGDLAFRLDAREVVREAFARFWNGAALDGPPWRMTPAEAFPLWADLAASADFTEDALAKSGTR